MMRTWFVSELYFPEETSTGYLLTRLAEGLAASRAVSVLCGQPTYSARGVRAPAREVRHGVAITRCWSTTFDKDRLAGRALNLLTISLSTFVLAVRRFRAGDVVIVVTNPPLLPYLMIAACWLRRAKYVLLVHDVYPEALYVAGLLRRGSMLGSIGEPVAAWPYRVADRVVVLGRDMQELVARKLRGSNEKTVLIPNWADSDTITPGNRASNPLLQELGLTSRWVVQYAGNMGRTHGLDSAIEAARKVADQDATIHFLFIGSGARFSMLQQAAKAARNVTVRGPRPRHDQQNFLNACDVALVCFGAEMAGVSVPSRMYNILAAGKPIIAVADAHSELSRVVLEDHIGWVVPPGRADLLAAAVLNARRTLASDVEMPLRAQRVAKRYSLLAAVSAYDAMVGELSSGVRVEDRAVDRNAAELSPQRRSL